jgi:ankyrin repeat protein
LSITLRAAGLCTIFASAIVSAAPSSPVADAAERGDTAMVSALLKQGADVNTSQGDGMTALHWAAMTSDPALATMLLHAGANPRAATRVGAYTPILLAARQGSSPVVKALLDGGADPNARTSNGTTALMFAAASGDVASVELLVARKVDLNAREAQRGLNAAMFAAAADRAAVLTALAKHGADLMAVSSPLDLRVLDRSKFAGVLFGNPEPPKTAGGQAGSVEPNAGRMGAPMGGASNRIPGVDRDFSGNELVNTHGGMTPLLFAARQGHVATAGGR